jgi:hypothetical protein
MSVLKNLIRNTYSIKNKPPIPVQSGAGFKHLAAALFPSRSVQTSRKGKILGCCSSKGEGFN